MRRFIAAAIASSFFITLAAPAAVAQDSGSPDIRTAADATRFRVIQRIPPPRQVTVEQLAWPYPDDVRNAVEQDDWAAAWKILETIPPDNDERFKFLWAWVALRGEAWDPAEKTFVQIAQADGLLRDYANMYASEAAFRAGRHDEASAYAARVKSGSVPHASASLILARSLVEKGTIDQGIRALKAFLDAFPNHSDVPTARVELARALHKTDKHPDAAALLVKVRRETPLWSGLDEEFEALEQSVFGKLSKKQRAALEERAPFDWLTEYRVRFHAHDSDDVISGLAERVTKWKKKTAERCEGLYLVGNSYTKLRKHADSVSWYERIVNECSHKHPHYIKALYKGGKGYWNAGKKDDAYRFFEKMWSEFPRHSYADDGMYFASRILSEQDKPDEASKLLQRQVRTYPDGDMASDGHWQMVREMLATDRYADVVSHVDSLTDTGEQDLYSQGRMHYFRARALQKLGKTSEAEAAYTDVVKEYPMGYYALFALNRLAQMRGAKGDDVCDHDGGSICEIIATTAGQPVVVDPELGTNESFRRGQAFLQVALDGFAQLEFNRLRRKVGDQPEKLWTLAALLDAAGAYPYSHNIARRKIDGWETYYPDPQRAERWLVGYPAPFDDEVTKWAKKRELPRALIWGIMREESGFNPRVRSWAGAIGLIQLMPGTAKNSARRDGASWTPGELTEPDYNVRLGTAYLDELAERANNHPVLMISGYNGGWGNVGGWLEDPDSNDLDLWVEDIPYGQTRHYTKRVLRSFWVYNWLYGDTRVPRFDLTVGG